MVKRLKAECELTSRVTPSVLLVACEVRAWLVPLRQSINSSAAILGKKNDVALDMGVVKSRRLSVLGGSINSFINSGLIEAKDKNKDGGGAVLDRKQMNFFTRLTNMSTSAMNYVGRAVGIDRLLTLNEKTVEEEYKKKLALIALNPEKISNRIWVLLELPNSSREAKALQFLIIFLIVVSIFMLFTQSLTSFVQYGEQSQICGEVLSIYCEDKSVLTDPGCYVQGQSGPTNVPLQFSCSSTNCFGFGGNFGSTSGSNMTCLSPLYTSYQPFQNAKQLALSQGAPYLFTSRNKMHKINDICQRIECSQNGIPILDGSWYWLRGELLVNIIFTIELTLRISVADSLVTYAYDAMNFFDVLSVLPFYIEVGKAGGVTDNMNFVILSSSPQPIVFVLMRAFKIFRLLKLTRHFRASKVISLTAGKVWKQILGSISLLMFLVVLFAIMLFEVESGTPCYIGDHNCYRESLGVPLSTFKPGARIIVNKLGKLTQYQNVFYGMWFSFVTLTTTGYGDIVPVTNGGKIMSIFLMLAGSMYMAVPLTGAYVEK